MIRTISAAALAIALPAGPTLADCESDIQRFNQDYADFLQGEIASSAELQPALQNLRDAAMLLHTHGNEAGCEAVLVTLTYLVDDYRRAGGQGLQQARTGAGGQATEVRAQAGEQAIKPAQQEQQAQEGQQAEQEEEQAQGGQQAGQQQDTEATQEGQAQGQAQDQGQAEDAGTETDQQAAQPDETAETATTAAEEDAGQEITPDERAQALAARTIVFTDVQMPIDAARLIGRELRNFSDAALGDVDGVLVSTSNGLTHLIVERGGFLGMGEKQLAVPVKHLRWDPEEEIFYVDVTEDQIDNAPEYERNSDEWVAEINDRWYDDPS